LIRGATGTPSDLIEDRNTDIVIIWTGVAAAVLALVAISLWLIKRNSNHGALSEPSSISQPAITSQPSALFVACA
jgi:hypothetical protein